MYSTPIIIDNSGLTGVIINNLQQDINDVRNIAQGKTRGLVFNTVQELEAWLLSAENVATLNIGDVFLIRDLDVPDYWFDGSTKQILETQKTEITTIPNSEIDELFNEEIIS